MKPLRKLRALFRKDRLDSEMADEMRLHVELQIERNIAAGMNPDDARYAALRQFGNVASIQEQAREERNWVWLEQASQDARYALRGFVKAPWFTAISVLSLMFGIGASTAVFSLVNALLLRSLPVPDPQELRTVQWTGTEASLRFFVGSMSRDGGRTPGTLIRVGDRVLGDSVSPSTFQQLRQHSREQTDLIGFATVSGVAARARREVLATDGMMVSGNFFSGLRVQALCGRLIANEDDRDGAAPVAVITPALWEKEFARDPDVVGQPLVLGETVFTIIGVLPREFGGVNFGDQPEFYVPLAARLPLMPGMRSASADQWYVRLMGRIVPGTSDQQIRAVLESVFAAETAAKVRDPGIVVADGRNGLVWNRNYYRKSLMTMLAAVGLIVLVACANLAGLSLARGATRRREFAVRAAMGASRWRLFRQSLVESTVLALTGGSLGVSMSIWGRDALSRLLAGSPDGLQCNPSLDLTVLAFAGVVTIITVLLFGLLPALRAGRVDPLEGLKDHGMHTPSRLRMGKILVVVQIALSVLLLTGAGLYARTMANLVRIHPGFATEDVLLVQLNPRTAGYTAAQLPVFYERIQTAISRLPGVRSVALTEFALLGGRGFFDKAVLPARPAEQRSIRVSRLSVSETFFATLEIPVLLGRGLTTADSEGAPKVVVVNETFVNRYLNGENPLGQVLHCSNIDWQIVGVCRDAKYSSIKAEVPPTAYFSYRQGAPGSPYFAIRTELPPMTATKAVRQAVSVIDPRIPLANVATQKQVRDRSLGPERLFAILCGALAALAVFLVCIGLYGLMATMVACRRTEIGIRLALGANPQELAHRIRRDALMLTSAGLAIGLPLALGQGRIVASQLYGVTPADPLVFVSGTTILLTVAGIAAWLPARRAAKVDPMVALRAE